MNNATEVEALVAEVERLKASVFRLEALNEHLEEESGWRDLAALMVEVERLKKAIKTAHADGARAIIASFDHVDPRARICELEAEVERLKADNDFSKWRFNVRIVDREGERQGPYNYVDLVVDDIGYADKGVVLSSEEPLVKLSQLQASEAEVERLNGDRVGWAARSQEQFDRIGVALERVRKHRESGEPSRDDATEVEALVEKVIHLEIESGHWIVRSMDLEKDVARLKAELERLRLTFLECAHCKAAMLVSTQPPCCDNCTLDEEDVEAWEEAVLWSKPDGEVLQLKCEYAQRDNELLKELFVWADNWLSDEAKDQGARAVLQKVRAAIEGTDGK